MLFEAAFVQGQNLGMLFGEPKRRRGCWGAKDDADSGAPKEIHGPSHPIEVEFSFLRLVKGPGELAHSDDIHTCVEHQFNIPFPAGFRRIGGPTVRIDPMLRIVIDAEIHKPDRRQIRLRWSFTATAKLPAGVTSGKSWI